MPEVSKGISKVGGLLYQENLRTVHSHLHESLIVWIEGGNYLLLVIGV